MLRDCQIYCGDGHGQHGRDKDLPGKDMAVGALADRHSDDPGK